MQNIDAHDWDLGNDSEFESGIETKDTQTGAACIYLKSLVPRPKTFGFLSKSLSAQDFLGKKIKLSASVKTAMQEGASVQLWLRVDGDWKKKPECFDNMYERRIRVTTDWKTHEVEVMVPEGSRLVIFGVLLNGVGHVWMDDVMLGVHQSTSASR